MEKCRFDLSNSGFLISQKLCFQDVCMQTYSGLARCHVDLLEPVGKRADLNTLILDPPKSMSSVTDLLYVLAMP